MPRSASPLALPTLDAIQTLILQIHNPKNKPHQTTSKKGIVKSGDEVEIVGIRDGAPAKTTVTGVEMFKKLLNQGQAGDNVGLLLRGLKREDVERGQLIAKPGSVRTHRAFEAEVYALTKEEGGRHTPFTTNYRPQFFFRTADITGARCSGLGRMGGGVAGVDGIEWLVCCGWRVVGVVGAARTSRQPGTCPPPFSPRLSHTTRPHHLLPQQTNTHTRAHTTP